MPLDQLFKDVYRVTPDRPNPNKVVTLFLKRKQGNLLFPCYSSRADITESFDEIDALGGLSMQLLCDSHFRTPHADVVAKRFSAPLWCSEPEVPQVSTSVKSVRAFPYTRHELVPGVEVIPTPGHRPGGTCFLVKVGKRRVLFAGDEIWHDPARGWLCAPTKAGVKKMRESIESLKGIEFDVLLPNFKVSDDEAVLELDNTARIAFLDTLLTTF